MVQKSYGMRVLEKWFSNSMQISSLCLEYSLKIFLKKWTQACRALSSSPLFQIQETGPNTFSSKTVHTRFFMKCHLLQQASSAPVRLIQPVPLSFNIKAFSLCIITPDLLACPSLEVKCLWALFDFESLILSIMVTDSTYSINPNSLDHFLMVVHLNFYKIFTRWVVCEHRL